MRDSAESCRHVRRDVDVPLRLNLSPRRGWETRSNSARAEPACALGCGRPVEVQSQPKAPGVSLLWTSCTSRTSSAERSADSAAEAPTERQRATATTATATGTLARLRTCVFGCSCHLANLTSVGVPQSTHSREGFATPCVLKKRCIGRRSRSRHSARHGAPHRAKPRSFPERGLLPSPRCVHPRERQSRSPLRLPRRASRRRKTGWPAPKGSRSKRPELASDLPDRPPGTRCRASSH